MDTETRNVCMILAELAARNIIFFCILNNRILIDFVTLIVSPTTTDKGTMNKKQYKTKYLQPYHIFCYYCWNNNFVHGNNNRKRSIQTQIQMQSNIGFRFSIKFYNYSAMVKKFGLSCTESDICVVGIMDSIVKIAKYNTIACV